MTWKILHLDSTGAWRVIAVTIDETIADSLFLGWVSTHSRSHVRLTREDDEGVDLVASYGWNQGSLE